MLDPRFLFPHFMLDPHAMAMLAKPPQLSAMPGPILPTKGLTSMPSTPTTFRIQDLLDAHKGMDISANTSGESDNIDLESPGDRKIDCSTPSAGSEGRSSPVSREGGSKKARKARTIFTDKQLQELETMFDKHKYLNVQDRMDLAQRMGLSDVQVKTWYQNRRTKWKRQASVGMELLSEAGNMAAVQQLIRSNPYWANFVQTFPPGGLNLMMMQQGLGLQNLPGTPDLSGLSTPPTSTSIPTNFSLPTGLIPPFFSLAQTATVSQTSPNLKSTPTPNSQPASPSAGSEPRNE